jgi:hypothetical protein
MLHVQPQAANQASMRNETRPTYDGAGFSILQAIWRVAAKIAVAVARNAIIILQVGRMCKAMLDARYPAQHSHVATCACAKVRKKASNKETEVENFNSRQSKGNRLSADCRLEYLHCRHLCSSTQKCIHHSARRQRRAHSHVGYRIPSTAFPCHICNHS